MNAKHLPVEPPEGCQWKVQRWYAGVSGLYLIESTRALRESSVSDLYYYETRLPPSMTAPDGSPTHSIGDTCISAFGHERIDHPDSTRAASKRLVRRFRKFARERSRAAEAAAYRRRKEVDLAEKLRVAVEGTPDLGTTEPKAKD